MIHRDRRAIILWLSFCLLLIAFMVLIGGYTRLSGSGLSITEWKPIHGAIPPLNESQWQEEFAAYQASPQYRKVNLSMTLQEFKTIFWPEFIHRLLARAIGMVFFLPLVAFTLRGSLSRRFVLRLTGIFTLGGLQGVAGWLMVASGLVDDPHVSHLRLAIHLSLALLIFALIEWALLDIAVERERRNVERDLRAMYHVSRTTYLLWFTFLCLQIILGALVAGLHAGLLYNTWPDMNGQLAPNELFLDGFIENRALIQFLHRTGAMIVALGFLIWWYLYRLYVKKANLGKVCAALSAVIAVQFTLGVATLLHQVPLNLALAHQVTALMLFGIAVLLLHKVTGHESWGMGRRMDKPMTHDQ